MSWKKSVTVSDYKEVSHGLLRKILRDAEISEKRIFKITEKLIILTLMSILTIGEVKIYTYARTPEQILQDYTAGLSTHFK